MKQRASSTDAKTSGVSVLHFPYPYAIIPERTYLSFPISPPLSSQTKGPPPSPLQRILFFDSFLYALAQIQLSSNRQTLETAPLSLICCSQSSRGVTSFNRTCFMTLVSLKSS